MRWQQAIDRCVRKSKGRALVDIPYIPITQSEIDRIKMLGGAMLQKLAFACLCIAKFRNATNPTNNSWVNMTDAEICSIANIKTHRVYRLNMLNSLFYREYISLRRSVGKLNVRVTFVDQSSENVVLRIDDFRNIGNQYMKYVGDPYIECQSCGIVVKRLSARQLYCKQCASVVDARKHAERYAASKCR